MELKALRRLLHWGPIFSLSIISFVTTVTIYSVNIRWYCPLGNAINISVFVVFACLAVYNFLRTVYTGPGYLPMEWRLETIEDEQHIQYCSICNGYKAPRSHHCRKCERCVLKMDHHCPWMNTCIGYKNHGNFTLFLLTAVCGSTQASILLIMSVIDFLNFDASSTMRKSLFSFFVGLFCTGITTGVILSLTALLYFQLKSILSNKTGIEYWIIEKADERREIDPTIPPFVYPYDFGRLQNFRQVFFSSDMGDGINWPVIEGCSKYDLTKEQLEQKALKRLRRRPYKVIYKYNGGYCPVSHGICTFFHPPYTTENRITLIPDELILVTRNHRYWLFGEKCASHVQMKCKGWFPKSCVVPVTNFRSQYNEERKDL